MATRDYYECHITMQPAGNAPLIKGIVEGLGWKYSAIDGDANLGDGVKVYATRQLNARLGDQECVRLLHSAAQALNDGGATILRRKVERVIYDDRSSLVGACLDNCAGCHAEDLAR